MKEQLPAPVFDAQNYERPNEKWICGYAAQANACRRGPDHQGRCHATATCTPLLEKKPGEEKGRWRCTRPGGACENGPWPDGSCCLPIVPCAPVPTLRTRRGQVTRAVVVATISLLLILLGGSWRGHFLNSGELSTPHASVKFARLHGSGSSSCAACHEAGASGPSGLISAAWHAEPKPWSLAELASSPHGAMTTIDQACRKCHTSHSLHQANVTRQVSCSYCHREHAGPGPIAATTDAHCSICHGDAGFMSASSLKGAGLSPHALPSGVAGEPKIFRASYARAGLTNVIRRFSEDHPEFRLHAEGARDPNELRFNHALHLTSDTIPKLGSGQKLDCLSCHQPEAVVSSFGRINFEKHCQECHSLQFDPETPGLTLPHGAAEFVSAFLRSLPKQYADFAARSGTAGATEQKVFAEQKLQRLQARGFSGEALEERAFFNTAASGPKTQVGSVSGATPSLYPGCAYCHEVTAGLRGQAIIERPIFLERWLARSRFDHGKHSAVSCTHCHSAQTSRSTEDIILPTKSVCASCHSASGGVKDSCTLCHTYHARGAVHR